MQLIEHVAVGAVDQRELGAVAVERGEAILQKVAAQVAEDAGVLLCGDYLSPCEIPFVEDAPRYRATLLRLLELLAQTGCDVIPGHGPRLDAAGATALARADLGYVDRLIDAVAERRDEALS